MKTRTLTALSALGLFLAAAAWTLHQQADYVFASLACRHGMPLMWAVTIVVLVLAAVGALIALRLPRSGLASEQEPDDRLRARKFLTSLSLLGLALFLFAIFLQASATLFLPSCFSG
jgi:hypothetical protein